MLAALDAVRPRMGRLCVRGCSLLVVAYKVAGAVSHQVSVCTNESSAQVSRMHNLREKVGTEHCSLHVAGAELTVCCRADAHAPGASCKCVGLVVRERLQIISQAGCKMS